MAKYSKKAQDHVAKTMKRKEAGKLYSSSGDKVTDDKQAVAIALSEAKEKGYKVPPNPNEKKAAKKAAPKKTAAKKATPKKAAAKKAAPKKTAAKKTTAKKAAPKKAVPKKPAVKKTKS